MSSSSRGAWLAIVVASYTLAVACGGDEGGGGVDCGSLSEPGATIPADGVCVNDEGGLDVVLELTFDCDDGRSLSLTEHAAFIDGKSVGAGPGVEDYSLDDLDDLCGDTG